MTLPGAFVGVLLGRASPLKAGITQLFVLLGLLVVEAAAIHVTVDIVSRGQLRLAERMPPVRQWLGGRR